MALAVNTQHIICRPHNNIGSHGNAVAAAAAAVAIVAAVVTLAATTIVVMGVRQQCLPALLTT